MQLIPSPHTHSAQDKKRILLKQQQQRLLLLRHASRCTVTGTCRATPHCAEMKRLWKHMSSCRKPKCDVPHCVSSRYVLSHYRKCNKRCEVCTPVREAIRGKMMAERQFAQARAAAAAAQAGGAPGNKRRAPSGTNDAARFANRASGTKRQRRSSVGGAPGGSDPRAAGKIPLRYPHFNRCCVFPHSPPHPPATPQAQWCAEGPVAQQQLRQRSRSATSASTRCPPSPHPSPAFNLFSTCVAFDMASTPASRPS